MSRNVSKSSKRRKHTAARGAAVPAAAPELAAASSPSTAASPRVPEYANRLYWWPRMVRLFKQEPALAITLSYLLVGLVGVWSSYWYYRQFGIPILQYYQVSDFLISGLREPLNFLALLLIFGFSALVHIGTVNYEIRNPVRVARMRKTRWGRLWFPEAASAFRRRRWYDIPPELIIFLACAIGGGSVMMSKAEQRADQLRAGLGAPLAITLQGSPLPLQGDARLIGTSSSHIFLYWPANGRTEAVASSSLARIERLPRQLPASKDKK
ncbi:MAG: hypothetical protein Q4G62_05755 [Pseudomonadota bacterium]|nr:hypothetical protein [Pseudomonadota bacterium]